jgi:hypothetical protein
VVEEEQVGVCPLRFRQSEVREIQGFQDKLQRFCLVNTT